MGREKIVAGKHGTSVAYKKLHQVWKRRERPYQLGKYVAYCTAKK
jgi:hypothetical protein